eukprot:302204-Prorocentrum_minimum.AAC.2
MSGGDNSIFGSGSEMYIDSEQVEYLNAFKERNAGASEAEMHLKVAAQVSKPRGFERARVARVTRNPTKPSSDEPETRGSPGGESTSPDGESASLTATPHPLTQLAAAVRVRGPSGHISGSITAIFEEDENEDLEDGGEGDSSQFRKSGNSFMMREVSGPRTLDEELANIHSWDEFDVFNVQQLSGGHALEVGVGYAIGGHKGVM